ncbi:MAG: zf-HC2 domain-containing protein [Betaproteobacteria bacterium]
MFSRVFSLIELARFINCRQAARLLSDAQDRPLSLADRIRLRLHLHWCVACTRYGRQIAFVRGALRRYRE